MARELQQEEVRRFGRLEVRVRTVPSTSFGTYHFTHQSPSIAHQSLRLARNMVAARRRRFNHRQRCEQRKKLRAKQSRSQREIASMKEEQEIRCRSLDSVQKKLMVCAFRSEKEFGLWV
ncbi:uncharacterized protein G2W53_014707 [Senna tora]|uniref:Uncharacterized protein n=1 Tax=Senna tora TaxID=362788 RepID=A0A834WTX6_9FABA|nr:uncharacterized protein G2W53_014707 [Senna tora]